MNRNALTATLCLTALCLAACEKDGRMAANSKLCADFKTAPAATGAPPLAIADAAAPVDDCVRRWAYSLAPSSDGAEAVAEAAVAACAAVLSRWNQQSIQTGPNDASIQALSLTTGEPTNPIQEHNSFANGRALFYVVQARAGRCSPPPVTNGVPAGLQS